MHGTAPTFGLAAVFGLREAAACLAFHALAKFSICQKIFLDRNEWGGDNIEESFFYAMEVCNEKSFCGAFGRVDDFFRVF